jgi:molybdate transport system substrate-binding protein
LSGKLQRHEIHHRIHHRRFAMRFASLIAAAVALLFSALAHAADIKVISTQATEEAYSELVAQFEKTTGHKVTTAFTGTLAVQQKLSTGEAFDLVIMAGPAIDEQIKLGRVVPGSRVDLASSGVAMAVPKGAPKPDISSVDALKAALLSAKSIGYSTGPSGVYLLGMFEKLGIADAIKGKLKQTPTGVFVGTLIANREVDIGFQQVSELVHFPGLDYVGPLPTGVQMITVFSAGVHAKAKEGEAAKALVKFLTASAAAQAYTKRGLQPG